MDPLKAHIFGDAGAGADLDDLAEDEAIARGGLLALSFLGKLVCEFFQPRNTSCHRPAPWSGQPALIRKSSLTWMLSTKSKQSSDRLQRVRSVTQERSSAGRRSPAWRRPLREEEISVGDCCVFEGDKLLVGRVLKLSYLSGKGKARQYSLLTAPTKPPQGE